MRRAAGAVAAALRTSPRSVLVARQVVSTSAAAEAAPAAAAATSRAANLQEFKIYRWNPEEAGAKPRLETYKASIVVAQRRKPSAAPSAAAAQGRRLCSAARGVAALRAPQGDGTATTTVATTSLPF
jgi:hypothetical protein